MNSAPLVLSESNLLNTTAAWDQDATYFNFDVNGDANFHPISTSSFDWSANFPEDPIYTQLSTFDSPMARWSPTGTEEAVSSEQNSPNAHWSSTFTAGICLQSNNDMMEEQKENLICSVCGDSASGKHYGANSCDGCKGFFRRTVRNKQKYVCRKERNCIINKETRNKCRSCRYTKSLAVGMKTEAVQNERDKISKKNLTEDETIKGGPSVSTLLFADSVCQPSESSNIDDSPRRMATPADLRSYVEGQLLPNLTKWAYCLPPFSEFSNEDKLALLTWNADKNLLLETIRHSLHYKNVLILGNDLIITKDVSDPTLRDAACKTSDQILEKLTALDVQPMELACIRAIIFFDPNADGLIDRRKVAWIRRQILTNFKEWLKKQYNSTDRLLDFLLLLPSVQLLSGEIMECIRRVVPLKNESVIQEYQFPFFPKNSDFSTQMELSEESRKAHTLSAEPIKTY